MNATAMHRGSASSSFVRGSSSARVVPQAVRPAGEVAGACKHTASPARACQCSCCCWCVCKRAALATRRGAPRPTAAMPPFTPHHAPSTPHDDAGRATAVSVTAKKVCELTGTQRNKANNVCFSNKKSRKWQEPNLQSKKVFWPGGQRWVRLRICTRAIKTIEKNGLDSMAAAAGLDLWKLPFEDARPQRLQYLAENKGKVPVAQNPRWVGGVPWVVLPAHQLLYAQNLQCARRGRAITTAWAGGLMLACGGRMGRIGGEDIWYGELDECWLLATLLHPPHAPRPAQGDEEPREDCRLKEAAQVPSVRGGGAHHLDPARCVSLPPSVSKAGRGVGASEQQRRWQQQWSSSRT